MEFEFGSHGKIAQRKRFESGGRNWKNYDLKLNGKTSTKIRLKIQCVASKRNVLTLEMVYF